MSSAQCLEIRKLISHGRLNAAEQRELQSRMERKQMKDFMNVSGPLSWATHAMLTVPRCTPTSCSDASTTASPTSHQKAYLEGRRDVS